MPAEDDLTAIVEIERLINEAARTQPGSERVRLSKALEDAVGKVVRQPQQHVAGEEALNNARAVAIPTSALVNSSTGLSFSAPDRAPASVTSRPSRIQVMPSATTTRV